MWVAVAVGVRGERYRGTDVVGLPTQWRWYHRWLVLWILQAFLHQPDIEQVLVVLLIQEIAKSGPNLETNKTTSGKEQYREPIHGKNHRKR